MGQLRTFVSAEDSSESSLVLVRVAQLAEINRRLGRDVTDELLRTIGQTIGDFSRRFPDGFAARLNGADFGLLLPGQTDSAVHAQSLLRDIVSASAAYTDSQPIAFIGTASFGFGANLSALLAQVDAALANAETSGENAVRHTNPAVHANIAQSADQWTDAIRSALEHRRVKLASFPVTDFENQLIHQECPVRLRLDEASDWAPAGQFMPMAERLGLTPQVDLAAIRLGMEELRKRRDLPGLAVNVSAASLKDSTFLPRVRSLLDTQPELTKRLWLEFTEHAVLAHFALFHEFCRALAGSECKLGVEHFGRQFSQIGRMHDLGLNYLKVDASFIRGIEHNVGNQAFLKGLVGISHNIGVQVYAEGVMSSAEMDTLAMLGFDGATGPIVKQM